MVKYRRRYVKDYETRIIYNPSDMCPFHRIEIFNKVYTGKVPDHAKTGSMNRVIAVPLSGGRLWVSRYVCRGIYAKLMPVGKSEIWKEVAVIKDNVPLISSLDA